MESDFKRKFELIRSLPWWGADLRLAAARQWWSEHKPARRIRAAQWESLARCGATAGTPEAYLKSIRDFFWYKKIQPDQPDWRGAVYRDWARQAWGYVGLAESLVEAIEAAGVEERRAGPPSGLAALISRFPQDSADRASLNSWRALSQMRDFVAALVLIARTAALARSNREHEVAGTRTEGTPP